MRSTASFKADCTLRRFNRIVRNWSAASIDTDQQQTVQSSIHRAPYWESKLLIWNQHARSCLGAFLPLSTRLPAHTLQRGAAPPYPPRTAPEHLAPAKPSTSKHEHFKLSQLTEQRIRTDAPSGVICLRRFNKHLAVPISEHACNLETQHDAKRG